MSPPLWVGLVINVLVPFLGVVIFFLLCRRMRRAGIQSAPFLAYFILFWVFGGWLVVALTALFWEWSGMASLGILYLLSVAPFITAAVAVGLRKRRSVSVFHSRAYFASVGYSGFAALFLLCWLGTLYIVH